MTAFRIAPSWLVRAAVLIGGLSITLPGIDGSQAQDAAPANDFRSLLLDSGLTSERIADLATWEQAPTAPHALAAVLLRLEQLERGRLATAAVPLATAVAAPAASLAGQLIEFQGRAQGIRRLELPADTAAKLHATALYACDVVARDGARLSVLTPHPPRPWLAWQADLPLDEPIAGCGALLRTASPERQSPAVILANRLQWHPAAGVPAGTLWLVSRGYDAALLDDVRQGRPFAKPDESREAEAFYRALALLAKAPAADLVPLARDAVAEAAEFWRAPPSGPRGRREQAIARNVAQRAKQGLSSVWPLYNAPAESVGKFYLLEGVARRAVRVVLDQPVDGLAHYYELDLFTPDSQNQPVICCVGRLPPGFPTGDIIREPVRVAGIFFKRWTYSRRPSSNPAEDSTLPERLSPPLLLAAEPQWLPPPEVAGRSPHGFWLGLALVAALGASGAILARIARRDRLARSRRARYDAPQDDLARL